MQIALVLASFWGLAEVWVNLNPNKIYGYSSEDAVFDLMSMCVILLLWDRFFGPYAVALRRNAKLLAKLYEERN
jgi:hypothetical protein